MIKEKTQKKSRMELPQLDKEYLQIPTISIILNRER